jgi:glycerol-3-phosphate O-acyltransferase
MKAILDQPAFNSELEKIAAESGRKPGEVQKQAARDLAEMQSARNALAVRLFAALGRFIYRRGYNRHPVFDLDEVERVRLENRQRSIVFLVTHKTYLDFFVLFDFLYRQGISTPYIFGGLNMNFAGFGALARRAGGIFIRRSFRDNSVYKAVLRRYIEFLIEQGSCFMWAIEGTRSRTGKLVTPRLGLLNYVGNASRNLPDDAISFIPVSVAYDQIPDVVDMAAQEAGAEKKPENLPWFMEYVRGLGGPFGNIHIRFGDPMAMTETPDAPDMVIAGKPVDTRRLEIQKLAFEVCYRINDITPATMTSLVMMVLLCRGPCDGEQIRRDVTSLDEYIRNRAGNVVSHRPSRVLDSDPAETVEALISTGVLRRVKADSDSVLAIVPERVSVAIYYSNMAVHHFVIRAFTELALVGSLQSSAGSTIETFWSECQRLRNLFKFEFFYSRQEEFRKQLRLELDSVDPDWQVALEQGDESVIRMLKKKPLLVAAGVLSPFLAAYHLVGEMIERDSESRGLAAGAFIAKCLETAHERVGKSGIRSVPGVSRALLGNGLRAADNRKLREDKADSAAKRAAYLSELESTAKALSIIDEISHSS